MDITKLKWHREGGAIVDDNGRTVLWGGWGKRGVSQRLTYEEQDEILKAAEALPSIVLTLDNVMAALLVITLTPHIVQYLEQTDPKALGQARAALRLCAECGQSDNEPGYEHKSSCSLWRDWADGYGHGV